MTKKSVGGNKAGRYVVDGEKVTDYAKNDKGALVDDYIDAAHKEGNLKTKRDHTSNEADREKVQEQLDAAADDATEKRNKMLDARRVMRDTFSGGLRETQGGTRPTSPPMVPPSTRSSSY